MKWTLLFVGVDFTWSNDASALTQPKSTQPTRIIVPENAFGSHFERVLTAFQRTSIEFDTFRISPHPNLWLTTKRKRDETNFGLNRHHSRELVRVSLLGLKEYRLIDQFQDLRLGDITAIRSCLHTHCTQEAESPV